jgi:NDP-sugar pyrophosphorylase family protein
MIKSIIHAGGESTRLKEFFSGPKVLAPIEDKPLLWFHLQPLIRSKTIKEYIFTLRHQHEKVQEYIEKIRNEINTSCCSIVEPRPLGRAGVVRLGIEKRIINVDETYLMSHPDDFVPINIKELVDYSDEAEGKGKAMIMVMSRNITNPFGIGVAKKVGDVIELKEFKEKPELPLIENHFANTGMILFLPEAMKEFKNVPLDKPTHPENDIVPKLAKQNKVAVFLVDRWISVNYASDYKDVLKIGKNKLLEFLNV